MPLLRPIELEALRPAWGAWVKASFDIFLPDLRTKLAFSTPQSKQQDQQIWKSFSQAIIYRLPSSMPDQDYSQPEKTKEIDSLSR